MPRNMSAPPCTLQLCRSTSTSWRVQELPCGRLLAHDVDFGGRGEATGDMVTSEVEFVDQGGKNTEEGYP